MDKDKIAYILLWGIVVQQLITFLTWMDYEKNIIGEWIITIGVEWQDLNWFVNDIVMMLRIGLLFFICGLIIVIIFPKLWGLILILPVHMLNLVTVMSDYSFIDRYDYFILTDKKIILLLGYIIVFIQLLRMRAEDKRNY